MVGIDLVKNITTAVLFIASRIAKIPWEDFQELEYDDVQKVLDAITPLFEGAISPLDFSGSSE
jgi:hypothetical protein